MNISVVPLYTKDSHLLVVLKLFFNVSDFMKFCFRFLDLYLYTPSVLLVIDLSASVLFCFKRDSENLPYVLSLYCNVSQLTFCVTKTVMVVQCYGDVGMCKKSCW